MDLTLFTGPRPTRAESGYESRGPTRARGVDDPDGASESERERETGLGIATYMYKVYTYRRDIKTQYTRAILAERL